jgi:uncharacterized protein
MKNFLKNPFIHVFVGYLVFGLFFIDTIYFLEYVIADTGGSYKDFAVKHPDINIYGNLAVTTIVLCLSMYLAKRGVIRFRKPQFHIKDLLYIGVSILAKIPITLFVVGVSYLLNMEITPSDNQELLGEDVAKHMYIMCIDLIILAPICEEFIFRKILIRHVFPNRIWLGLVVSSVLFGSLHMIAGFNLLMFINYTLMGAVFGWIYIRSGRIESSIYAHSINNLLAFILMVM